MTPELLKAMVHMNNTHYYNELLMNGKWCERERNYVSKEWDCGMCRVCKERVNNVSVRV